MKIVGIIVEYNPLHNGHLYHFNKIKEESNADIIIAIMSSSFCMRGDLSIFDKFTKARQAIKLGVDIVIELPLVLSMQRADIFANNAIKFLNILGVTEIWIGSELNDIKYYEKYYEENKNIDNKNDFKISFKNRFNLELESNDILGYSYYKSIKDNNFNIDLKTIKRYSSNYNEITPNNSFITSANAIRCDLSLIDNYCPKFVIADKDKILNENKLFDYIKYKILSSTTSYLKKIFFVDEGIENKLQDIKDYENLNDFINYLSNKRYSKTRIKRMLIYILFDILKDDINNIPNIDFVRLLAYNEKGKNYISSIKKNINIYTNIKNGINIIFDIELKVSKILDSIYNLNLFNLEQKGPIEK